MKQLAQVLGRNLGSPVDIFDRRYILGIHAGAPGGQRVTKRTRSAGENERFRLATAAAPR
jgi:hypothetical protein